MQRKEFTANDPTREKTTKDKEKELCFAEIEIFTAQSSADHDAKVGYDARHVCGSDNSAAEGGDHCVLQTASGGSEVLAG